MCLDKEKRHILGPQLKHLITLTIPFFGSMWLSLGCTDHTPLHVEKATISTAQGTSLKTPLVRRHIDYNNKTGIISMPGTITTVAFSPDSQYIACASVVDAVNGNVVVVFNATTGLIKTQFITNSTVESLIFSSDNQRLFTGCFDHNGKHLESRYLQVWDVENNKLLRTVSQDTSFLTATSKGHLLASAEWNAEENRHATISILNTTNWQKIHKFAFNAEAGILEDISFSPDERWLGALFAIRESSIHELWIWDSRNGKRLLRIADNDKLFRHPAFSLHLLSPIVFATPTNDRSKAYIYCGNTRIEIGYREGKLTILNTSQVVPLKFGDLFAYERFNPKRAVLTNYDDARVQHISTTKYEVWDLNLRKVIASWRFGDTGPLVEFSPNGRLLALVSPGNKCRILKLPQ